MARRESESRFGFGQLSGSTGAILLGVGVSQPWLKLDGPRAVVEALKPGALDRGVAGQVVAVFSRADPASVDGSPAALRVAEQVGIGGTGWEQNPYLAAALIVAALLALIGVVRSVTAASAWAARSFSPLLALAGFASLVVAALALWVVAPDPRAAMRPDLGLWLVAAGGILLLIGALTLGNNRRRPWIDELEANTPKKVFDNTEHLAYSHGAWVPKLPDDG